MRSSYRYSCRPFRFWFGRWYARSICECINICRRYISLWSFQRFTRSFCCSFLFLTWVERRFPLCYFLNFKTAFPSRNLRWVFNQYSGRYLIFSCRVITTCKVFIITSSQGNGAIPIVAFHRFNNSRNSPFNNKFSGSNNIARAYRGTISFRRVLPIKVNSTYGFNRRASLFRRTSNYLPVFNEVGAIRSINRRTCNLRVVLRNNTVHVSVGTVDRPTRCRNI